MVDPVQSYSSTMQCGTVHNLLALYPTELAYVGVLVKIWGRWFSAFNSIAASYSTAKLPRIFKWVSVSNLVDKQRGRRFDFPQNWISAWNLIAVG